VEETRLWRVALFFLVLLSVGMAAAAWDNVSQISVRFGALPIAAALAALGLSYYVGRQRHTIAVLRSDAQKQIHDNEREGGEVSHLLHVIGRSQQGYRQLVDSFEEVVLAVSLDGKIQAANRAFANLVGLEFPDFVFHGIGEFVVSPTLEEAKRLLPRVLERRHWNGMIQIGLRNDATARYFDCAIQAIQTEGQVTGFSIWGRDITEKREREARFTELFETLHEGVYFTTPDGRILDVNQALVHMLGYQSRSELLAMPVIELYVDPEDRPRRLEELNRKATHDREVHLRRRDGKQIICLDSSRAIYDADGQVIRYQGTLVDITERRQMESEIQQQQQFKRRLIQCFPDAILVIDKDLRYTFASTRVHDILGWRPEEMIGRTVQCSSQSTEPARLYRELLDGREQLGSVEFVCQHRDGTWKTLRCSASRLVGPDNDVAGVVASLRDITQAKLIEQQLVQAERLAAMGHMIDGFAHELNNPLTAILGAIDLLDLQHGESSPRHLKLLKEQSRRAAEIVQNLLFFSRPPMRGNNRLNLNDLIQRTLLLQQYSLRIHGISVDFLPEAKLPTVEGDGNQLMQVFLNLLINAEQAISSFRERGCIRVRAGSNEEEVWISFQDDGPGVAENTLRNMFDPFYSTKRPGGGTGMGLSVALGIVRNYGGNITFQPAPGNGAVFTVTLPRQPMELVGIPLPASASMARVN
jgi:PAS domain S-box-containing protein